MFFDQKTIRYILIMKLAKKIHYVEDVLYVTFAALLMHLNV